MNKFRILWIKKESKTNSFTLPKNFQICEELKKDVEEDDQFHEDILEGYSAMASILIQKGCNIKFLEEKQFETHLMKWNISIFKNIDIIIYGNWPFAFPYIEQVYQNLENLCIFGIKVFPTPSDVLFIANKHW